MDAKLLDILVCPLCKGPLIYKRPRQELICKPCRLAYQIQGRHSGHARGGSPQATRGGRSLSLGEGVMDL